MYLMKERRSGYQDRGGERIISRMYSISPSDPERFYLRLLLLHVPGVKSLDELKMIGGRIAVSFRETCIFESIFLQMTVSMGFQMPRQLRNMFANYLWMFSSL